MMNEQSNNNLSGGGSSAPPLRIKKTVIKKRLSKVNYDKHKDANDISAFIEYLTIKNANNGPIYKIVSSELYAEYQEWPGYNPSIQNEVQLNVEMSKLNLPDGLIRADELSVSEGTPIHTFRIDLLKIHFGIIEENPIVAQSAPAPTTLKRKSGKDSVEEHILQCSLCEFNGDKRTLKQHLCTNHCENHFKRIAKNIFECNLCQHQSTTIQSIQNHIITQCNPNSQFFKPRASSSGGGSVGRPPLKKQKLNSRDEIKKAQLEIIGPKISKKYTDLLEELHNDKKLIEERIKETTAEYEFTMQYINGNDITIAEIAKLYCESLEI